jgi:hypothetical protein
MTPPNLRVYLLILIPVQLNTDTNTQEPNFIYAQLIKELLTKLEYSELDKKDMPTTTVRYKRLRNLN